MWEIIFEIIEETADSFLVQKGKTQRKVGKDIGKRKNEVKKFK